MFSAISVVVIVLCVWLRISPQDWAVIVLTMAMVWSAEFFNTSLEILTDIIHPQEHPSVKLSKDISAGAVLITAAAAALIGILILGPPLWKKMPWLTGK